MKVSTLLTNLAYVFFGLVLLMPMAALGFAMGILSGVALQIVPIAFVYVFLGIDLGLSMQVCLFCGILGAIAGIIVGHSWLRCE